MMSDEQDFSFFLYYLPQADNEAVKDVEAITDVLDEPVGRELENHLHGEDAAEDEIADLHDSREGFRLVVVLDTHAEGVDEDAGGGDGRTEREFC